MRFAIHRAYPPEFRFREFLEDHVQALVHCARGAGWRVELECAERADVTMVLGAHLKTDFAPGRQHVILNTERLVSFMHGDRSAYLDKLRGAAAVWSLYPDDTAYLEGLGIRAFTWQYGPDVFPRVVPGDRAPELDVVHVGTVSEPRRRRLRALQQAGLTTFGVVQLPWLDKAHLVSGARAMAALAYDDPPTYLPWPRIVFARAQGVGCVSDIPRSGAFGEAWCRCPDARLEDREWAAFAREALVAPLADVPPTSPEAFARLVTESVGWSSALHRGSAQRRSTPAGRDRSRVALTMIVRNEARNLEDCLAPVRHLFQEMVIVDTGSTDATREVARALGARVYQVEWQDDFAAARNEAIRHVQSPWIFWLDADDRVSEPNVTKLQDVFERLDGRPVGYAMTLSSLGQDGEPLWAGAQVRLFPRIQGVRWEGRVHEHVAGSLLGAGCSIESADVEIVHVGYMAPALSRAKLERNLGILDRALEDEPFDAVSLFHRGKTLLELGRPAEALVALLLCEPGADVLEHRALAEAKARALAGTGDLEDAHRLVARVRCFYPRDPNLRLLESELLAAMGAFAEAAAGVAEAFPSERDDHLLWHGAAGVRELRRRHLRAEIAFCRGDYHGAVGEADAAVQLRPSFGPGWLTAAEACLRLGESRRFDEILERFESDAKNTAGARVLLAARASTRGDNGAATRILEEGLREAPGDAYLLRALAERSAELAARDREGRVVQALAALPLCPRLWSFRRALSSNGSDAQFRVPA